MAGTKKGKAVGKAKSAKGKDKSKAAPKDDTDVQAPKPSVGAPQLTNQERVERVKAFWKEKPQDERVNLLTVAYEDVLKAAKEADEQYKSATLTDGSDEDLLFTSSHEEILVGGMARKRKTGTWKEWTWPEVAETFTSQDDFRAFLQKYVYPTALQKYLPHDTESRTTELPAETALRKRMADLWKEVNESLRVFQEQVQDGNIKFVPAKHGHKRTRPTPEEVLEATKQQHIDMIIKMMAGLCAEHDLLYTSISHPIMLFVCANLPDEHRDTRHQGELFFEDLQKLPWEDVVQVSEWLMEKVDGLAASWKDNREEDTDDNQHLADVDLFAITEDDKSLEVHPTWLNHLQERIMGEDGNPHKSTAEEDPERIGLVLEWVYGCIVSTAEKARENARRHLHPAHPPDTMSAWQLLLAALKEQQNLEETKTKAKELLRDMLASRQNARELNERFQLDKKPIVPKNISLNGNTDSEHPCAYSEEEFPTWVIVDLLKREKLLTHGKLHVLKQNLEAGLRQVRLHRYRQRQGEPVFERLKKQLDEVKNAHRGIDGNYRSTADLDRQRQVMADQAIEEQLHAQTAFRQQGTHLQGVVNQLHAQEMENRKLDQEMKQLHSWKQTIASVISRLEEHIASVSSERQKSADDDAEAEAAIAEGDKRILRLRNQFFDEMRKQLYTEKEDKYFYGEVQKGIKAIESRMEEVEVVISQLEQQLLNVACDDPGSTVGMVLLLPLLCDRLDALAQEHAKELASKAEQELIRLNEEQSEKEKLEREKKKQQKAKAKERQKVGKDKDRAEREAKENADRTAAEDAAKRAAEAEQLERKRKQEALEALRKAEEEMLENRRQELLKEENGFWRLRMEQEQLEKQFMMTVDDAKDIKEIRDVMAPSSRSSMDGNRRRRDGSRENAPSSREYTKPGGRGGRREPGSGRRSSRDPPERRMRDDTARGGGRPPPYVREARDTRDSLSSATGGPHRSMSARDGSASAPTAGREAAGRDGLKNADVAPAGSVPAPAAARAAAPAARPPQREGLAPHGAAQGSAALSSAKPVLAPTRPASAGSQGAKQPLQPAAPQAVQVQHPTAPAADAKAAAPQAEAQQQPLAGPRPVSAPAAKQQPTADAHAQPAARQPQHLPSATQTSAQTPPPSAQSAAPSSAPRPVLPPVSNAVPRPVIPPAAVSPSLCPPGMHPMPQMPLSNAPPNSAASGGQQPAGAQARPMLPTLSPVSIPPLDPTQPPFSGPHPGFVPSMPVPHAGIQPVMAPRQVQPGSVPPHMMLPGTLPPGSVPPGAMAPGTVPPGSVPSAVVPPGSVPHSAQQVRPSMPLAATSHAPMPANGLAPSGPSSDRAGPQRTQAAAEAGPGPRPARPDGLPQPRPKTLSADWQPALRPAMPRANAQQPQHPATPTEVRPHAKQPAVLATSHPQPDASRPEGPRPVGQPTSGPSPSGNAPATPAASGALPGKQQLRPPYTSGMLQPSQHINPSHMAQYPAAMMPPGMMGLASAGPASAGGGAGPGPGAARSAAPTGPLQPTSADAQRAAAMHHPLSASMAPNLAGTSIYSPYANAQGQHLYAQGNMVSMPLTMMGASHMMQPPMSALPQGMMPQGMPMMYPQPGAAQHAGAQPGVLYSGASMPGAAPSSPSHQNIPIMSHQMNPMMHMPLQMPVHLMQQAGMPRPGARQSKGLSARASEFIPYAIRGDSSSSVRTTERERAGSEASTGTVEGQQAADAARGVSAAQPAPSQPTSRSTSATTQKISPPLSAGQDSARSDGTQAVSAARPAPQEKGEAASADACRNTATSQPPLPNGKAPSAAPPLGIRHAGVPARADATTPLQGGASNGTAASTALNGVSSRSSSLAKLTHEHDERLRLVRRIGLINEQGQHNCFLNVVVQALWHLPAFARGLMAIKPETLRGKENYAQEWRLLSALQRLFHAFHAAHDTLRAAAPVRDGQPALSPNELRCALPDKLFKRSEMHDAGEVLHEIFQALHVAEVGNSEADPTLPARTLVNAPTPKPKAGTWAAKAASPGPSSNGTSHPPPPSSFVHRIFGLHVQVPVAGSKPLAGEVPGQQLYEVERYSKYFHHVMTHFLVRKVSAAAREGKQFTWNQLLQQATVESEAQNGVRSAAPRLNQLLSRPAVLSLMLVWDSVQANSESIASVVHAMQDCHQLSLSDLFVGVASPCVYRLRCIICYYRHHYNAMVFSDEEGWLLFDDSHIEKPGDWKAILAKMENGLQPSILFYEAMPSTSQ